MVIDDNLSLREADLLDDISARFPDSRRFLQRRSILFRIEENCIGEHPGTRLRSPNTSIVF